jgi:hypothetical protein
MSVRYQLSGIRGWFRRAPQWFAGFGQKTGRLPHGKRPDSIGNARIQRLTDS